MIIDDEKWHYHVVKQMPALLRVIRCANNGDIYCINCLHSFKTKNKLKNHKNVSENYDYFHVEMPKKIIKY